MAVAVQCLCGKLKLEHTNFVDSDCLRDQPYLLSYADQSLVVSTFNPHRAENSTVRR